MRNVILVPIDFSDVTDLVLAQAARLSRELQSSIRLVHAAAHAVPSGFGELGPDCGCYSMPEYGEELREELDDIRDNLAASGLKVSAFMLHGSPADVISRQAELINPGLIVLGSHGRGTFHQLLSGSVLQKVLRKVSCPVLVVPARMVIGTADAIHAAALEEAGVAT